LIIKGGDMHTARWHVASGVLAAAVALGVSTATAQTASTQPSAQAGSSGDQPTFRAGVDLVTIRAVVRDSKGRTVQGLGLKDFELVDNGIVRQPAAVEHDNGPIGIALLFDVSGSMDIDERFGRAREAGYFLLSGLRTGEDEAAIFAFDSALHIVQPFTNDLERLRGSFSAFSPWGMTSIHDAIALASRSMDTRATKRRALVVLTDGFDTSSKLDAPEVSRIASSIDLPVYVLAVVPTIDDPRTHEEGGNKALTGDLANLAHWTGGDLFVATSTPEASTVSRALLSELRDQYLIAIEPGAKPGWHSVEVRVRRKGHTVQARGGYMAGSNRPGS
jgi:Ca-activated chloride channel family protein